MNLNGRLSFTGNVHGSMGAQLVADVEANPSGSPSQTLVSIRVGDVIYSIPAGGGGGGTSDYNALNNKPKVNNITLSGDLTLADLGIQPAISFPGDGSKYLDGDGNFSTPAAGYDYSTSEVNTGQKWIDGSFIYRKTYLLNTLAAGQDNIIPLNISNFKTLIKVFGNAKMQAMPNIPIPFISSNLQAYIINPYNIDENTSLHIETGTLYTNENTLSNVTITILYTKTTD